MKERLIRKFFNPNYSFNMLRHTISSRSHVRNPLYTPETPPERPIFSSHSWQPCQHDPVPSLFPISYTVLSRSLASSLNPLLPSSPSVVSQNDGSEIRFLSSQADFEFFKSIVYMCVYIWIWTIIRGFVWKRGGYFEFWESCFTWWWHVCNDFVKRFSPLCVGFRLGFAYGRGVERKCGGLFSGRRKQSLLWTRYVKFRTFRISFPFFLPFLNFLNFFPQILERERGRVIDLGILFFIPRNLRFAIFQVEEYSVLNKI